MKNNPGEGAGRKPIDQKIGSTVITERLITVIGVARQGRRVMSGKNDDDDYGKRNERDTRSRSSVTSVKNRSPLRESLTDTSTFRVRYI